MMEIDAIAPTSNTATAQSSPTGGLGADDFLKLLVTQLTNQDPLSPTSNADLLQQLSSIRDIQLSTSLVDSLTALTGSQRYGAAAALIGKHVTGRIGDEVNGFQSVGGAVVGIHFNADGSIALELDSGVQLPMDQLQSVTSPQHAAESLIGRLVRGLEGTDDEDPEVIEGIVTAVRTDDRGEVVLELDTGEELSLSDVVVSQQG